MVTGRCKKCWGQPAAAKSFTDKEGLEAGRLWQSPIISHLPVTGFYCQLLRNRLQLPRKPEKRFCHKCPGYSGTTPVQAMPVR